ncbi:hypothetical protein [Sideroxydans sp. CL21]|nr:hypothetical protein [Sideroxydans sp. CL21]
MGDASKRDKPMLTNASFRTILVGLIFVANAALADDTKSDGLSDKGFSFFVGLAGSSVRYQENTGAIKSKAQTNNLIINSGALYAIDHDYLLSIENQSTFYPGNATESWNATSPFSAGGYSFNTGLLQQDDFSLSQSSTRLFLHKRIANEWFVMGGPSFNTNSFKRSAFVAAQPGVNTSSVVEETASEILVNLGIGLESEQVLNRPDHYSLSLTAGVPVWRRVTNTDNPGDTFTNIQGYDVWLEGRYSWAIKNNIQIGLWGQLSNSSRGSQTIGLAELPNSRLETAGYGLELLWKL